MTDSEWVACEDPTLMLRFVKGHRTIRKRSKLRKQRLVAVACCRRLQPLLDDERNRRCIEVVERFADEQATNEELRAAEKEASDIWLKAAGNSTLFACVQLCYDKCDGLHVSTTTMSAAFEREKTDANEPFDPLDGRRSGACPSEARAQSALIRDIFGNPFRPVTSNPSWLTSTVLDLARQMYDTRDFSAMPILADALQDAGCDNDDFLNHCLGAGAHVRGCWVVDAILGKS
jgi:hypothetical protein